MKGNKRSAHWLYLTNVTSISVICVFVLFLSSPVIADDFEKPGPLKAQSVLPSQFIKGEHFEVEETVQNDGIFNTYEMNSSYGKFTAMTTSSLFILIKEIEAIAAMKKVETDDTALASLKQSGENTVTGLKNLFTEPEETLGNAASGVKGLFNRAKGTVGKRKVTGAEDNKLEQLVGLSKAKGRIATQYGVNAYSRNEVLQKELDRLARADFVGGLGAGVVTSFVPGVGGLILSTSGTARLLNEAINTTPASELWLQNKSKLLKMAIDEDTVELFLNNPVFSPALQTLLVTSLEAMKGVSNRELFIKVSLQASDPDMAKIIMEIAVLTAGYHKNIGQLKTLAPMARLTMAKKEDGSIVVVLPTDYVIWSKSVAEIVGGLAEKVKVSQGASMEMWTLGDYSERTKDNLKEMGWQVHVKARKQLMPAKK